MRTLLNYFFRGVAVIAPLAVTAYVCWRLFEAVDSWLAPWLGPSVPGVGFAITVAGIIAVGFLASTFLARTALGLIEQLLARLPLVRLLYGSTKDLLNAFVGEQRRFDRPVAVTLYPEAGGEVLGFVTSTALEHLGLGGRVAVYLPMSYSVAGHVVLFPAERVRQVAADSADVMAFLVSGGVARGAAPPPGPLLAGVRPNGWRPRPAPETPPATR
jgi:uncharacterized membrane protein